jgi:hypothetical protein
LTTPKTSARVGEHSPVLARLAVEDPDLAQVVGAWPMLPDSVRRAVLALVGATVG